MARFQQRSIGPFGGLNEDENPHAIDPNDLVEALNVVHRGNTLGTRPGLIREASGKQYENATTGTNPIQGLHEHRENVDTGRHLLAVGNDGGTQNVFHDDASLLPNSATITGGQDNVWTFASHNNNTYAAGGAAADHFWYFNGNTGVGATQIDALDSAAASLQPKYVLAWRNYLFLGGLRGGVLSDNNTSNVRFADFASDPTVAANWKVGNTIGFTAFGSSHNTGLASFKSNNGDWLLILYNDHIDSVTLDPKSGFNVPFFINDKVANGCVSQRAYVGMGVDAGDAIYMSERGFHSLRQSQEFGGRADKFISWKIRPLFKTLNLSRLQYTVGAYDFRNGRIVFAVSTGSNTVQDTLLCLDVTGDEPVTADNARWTVWRVAGNSRYVNELKMLRDEDDVWRLYFGTDVGDVGYFDDDTFADFGSSYTARFQTAHDAMGSILSNKNLGDISITLQPGGTYQPTMKFHFDYGRKTSTPRLLTMPDPGGALFGTDMFGAGIFGSSAATRDEKVYGSGSGRTVGFSVEHAAGGEPFWVSKIDYQVRVTGEDTGDTASGA